MSPRRIKLFVIIFILGIQTIGMFWGSPRLAWVAARNLYDFKLYLKYGPIFIDEAQSSMSLSQREFLRSKLPEKTQQGYPKITVSVCWDYTVIARARSFGSSGPGGFESNDAIYLNVFGFWVELYSYGHSIACG